MEFIGAGSCGDNQVGAATGAILRGIIAGLHPQFGDGFQARRSEHAVIASHVGILYAIERDSAVFWALPVHSKSTGAVEA